MNKLLLILETKYTSARLHFFETKEMISYLKKYGHMFDYYSIYFNDKLVVEKGTTLKGEYAN